MNNSSELLVKFVNKWMKKWMNKYVALEPVQGIYAVKAVSINHDSWTDWGIMVVFQPGLASTRQHHDASSMNDE